MKFLANLIVVSLLMLINPSAFSNNILIENVSLEDQVAAEHYVYIEFDLSWDNSWRTTAVPNNWDAAWVFCKYRIAGGEWRHVYLHFAGHTAPGGAAISLPGDSTGVFIYRDSNGSGSNNWDNIRLRWDYGYEGVNDDAALEVKVLAIEMVYVNQGAYYLGDSTSNDHYFTYNNPKSFYRVTSEAAILTGFTEGYLYASGMYAGAIPAAYPKGYQAFYVMKYELSQEQYTGFLNSLTRTQQNTRTATDISGTTVTNVFVMSGSATVIARNGIRCNGTLPAAGPVNFYSDYDNDGIGNEANDGQNIACNFLNWPDLAAYLDWAGLRIMTQLEFEKACRGPNNPVGGEFAWGNALIHGSTYTIANAGAADEVISSMPENTGNCLYNATDPYSGHIMRCGIFAASSVNHTRMETGATFYGIMEMSGNVFETSINTYHFAGWSFTGLHGNGELLTTGDADVNYWPGINGNEDEHTANTAFLTSGVTSYAGTGFRGSNTIYSASGLPISSREFAAGWDLSERWNFSGGRGCRTSP